MVMMALASVVLARQQHPGFEFLQLFRKALHLALEIAVDVFAFARQLEQRVDVGSQAGDTGRDAAIASSSRLRSCMMLLALFRLIPEIRIVDFALLAFASSCCLRARQR